MSRFSPCIPYPRWRSYNLHPPNQLRFVAPTFADNAAMDQFPLEHRLDLRLEQSVGSLDVILRGSKLENAVYLSLPARDSLAFLIDGQRQHARPGLAAVSLSGDVP